MVTTNSSAIAKNIRKNFTVGKQNNKALPCDFKNFLKKKIILGAFTLCVGALAYHIIIDRIVGRAKSVVRFYFV